jgi:putative ABC transport system permease protein
LNTGIIIASLAIGMACVNLIAMFIQRELNTDGFHEDKDRIYALKCDFKRETLEQIFECGKGAAEYMKTNFSQVEDFCRIFDVTESKVVVNDETYFDRPRIVEASKNFFEFFTYKLLTNNPKTVLEAKNNLVISEELAHKYFGSVNAVGQVITLGIGKGKEAMVVAGIFRTPVDNSQLKFDMVRLIPDGWTSTCYVKLKHNSDPEELDAILKANKDIMPGIQAGIPGLYHLKSLRNSYFDDSNSWGRIKSSRDLNDLWIALVIGLVIICIATFNYLGLLNNNLLEKSKTYAIQRVNGGSKFSFMLNFMTESLFMVGLSFIISLSLMLWMAPFFNGLTNTNINANFIFRPEQILMQGAVVALLLITTFLFLSYRISSNINFSILKPSGNQMGKRIQFPAFNIFQLASSIILILISAVIVKQANFITNKPIGLDKNIIAVKIPDEYISRISAFGEELIANSSIAQVSRAAGTPVFYSGLGTLKFKENGVEKEVKLNFLLGDQNYVSIVGIQLIEGSGFSGNPSEDKNKLLINESLARLFPGQNLIGTSLPGYKGIVIGIVKDFQYLSLKSFVEPAAISYEPTGYHMLVKPSKNQIAQAHQVIARVWKELIPDYPLNLETIGDQYEWLHRENKNYLQLIGACCFISIFLSMIGLFAISYQSSRYRTKEIGIRKVNGAKISEVMVMLNKDAVKWVAIAFIIACPIAWYAMHRWLENYAYKTELSWWIFAIAGLLALGIALLTVSWQSWKAATRNPVESLRCE